jgi:hypothetical protein
MLRENYSFQVWKAINGKNVMRNPFVCYIYYAISNLCHHPYRILPITLIQTEFLFFYNLNAVYQQMLTVTTRALINDIRPKTYTVCYCHASNASS